MAEIGKVRIRVPSSIKAGGVIQGRTLVIHPMERVERDPQGRIVRKRYNYVNRVVVTYLGRTVATFETTQSVSENPFFSFTLRATAPGRVRVQFFDTPGGDWGGTVAITL